MKESLVVGSTVATVALIAIVVLMFPTSTPPDNIPDSSDISFTNMKNDAYLKLDSSDVYTELIEFSLKEGVDQADFLESSNKMQEEFFKNHPGFISRHVIKSELGEGWMVISRYQNAEQCQLAGDEIFNNMESFEIFDYIDEQTMMTRNFIEKSSFQMS